MMFESRTAADAYVHMVTRRAMEDNGRRFTAAEVEGYTMGYLNDPGD